ncbi:TPA: hypothetical protein ACQWFG_000339 [Neisseria subflava]|uniref:hypothetical protein n=1 Tax=Neisseria sp. P0006.S010 TaxID=3436693 RepID=UPI003F7EE13C
MVWDHLVTTKTACVRTAHTLHLNLKVCVARSGRVCGLATHAVDRSAGYGLLRFLKVQATFDKERPSENYFSDGL